MNGSWEWGSEASYLEKYNVALRFRDGFLQRKMYLNANRTLGENKSHLWLKGDASQ